MNKSEGLLSNMLDENESLMKLATLARIEFLKLKIRKNYFDRLFDAIDACIMHLHLMEEEEIKFIMFTGYQNALAYIEDCRHILKEAGISKTRQSKTLRLLESQLKVTVRAYRPYQHDYPSLKDSIKFRSRMMGINENSCD